MKERFINCDLLRIFAFILVISVHSINYVGFYGVTNNGITMLILNIVRVFFMACVPLFMVLTGYLMNKKEISKEYYLKIFKILLTYILCSAVCYTIMPYINNTELKPFSDFLLGVLNFNAAPYAWYVEMYIGLYLIIPFLNILWKNLDEKCNKQLLIFILFTTFTLPTITNLKEHIIPSFWFGNCYPLLYYYIGCYLKDYQIKLDFKKTIILLIMIVVNGLLTFNYSYGTVYINGIFNNYYSFGSFASTILFSLIIFNLKINIKSEKVNKIIAKISYLTFGGYLLSYIYDITIYPLFIDNTKYISYNVLWLPLIIIIIVVLSLISSFFVDLIEKLILKILNFIINYRKESTNENKY